MKKNKLDIAVYISIMIVVTIAIIISMVKINNNNNQKVLENKSNNLDKSKIVEEESNNLILYGCKEGNKLYINKISDDIIDMTIIHLDDTYSSVLLEKKEVDSGIVYADEYNVHKLFFNKDEALFTINDTEVATSCKIIDKNGINLPEIFDKTKVIESMSDRMDYMLYGDPALNRVVIMKLSTFEKVGEFNIGGENVYCIDHVSDKKSYVMPRGSDFIQIINGKAKEGFKLGEKIKLPFHPRTGAKNDFINLELISSKNKAMFALIDLKTDKVLYTGGRNEVTNVVAAYGGKNSTGHAKWLSPNYFIFSDRSINELSLYHVVRELNDKIEVVKTDSVKLPLSIHTFFDIKIKSNKKYEFYGTAEGDNKINGGVVELFVNDGKLTVGRTVRASGGVHHAEAHPTQDIIYIPTGNGYLDIIDKKTMKVIKTIKTGKGSGHVIWVKKHGIALVLNHKDTYVTVIDMEKHEKIKNIEVAKDNPKYDTILQSHSTRISPDSKYYYGFATDNGTFFRVNLETLELNKELYVGGTPKQASQPSELSD